MDDDVSDKFKIFFRRLYALITQNGTIELKWKNPGRIEMKKGDLKDENETLKDEEDQKEDVSF